MGYPQDIKPLTGLRFVAAFWLLLYFFWGRLGLPDEATPGLVERGYLGVDLFFVLSGFVLAHVYGPQVESGRFHYGAFIWARLARIYPLHLVTLAAMLLIWVAGTAVGASFYPPAFDLSQIPHHILMIHAWGVIGSDGWNFPSWSISAEWFAYLAFPLLFGAVAFLRRWPLVALILSMALFVVLYLATARQGVELTSMTWQGGIVRIVPSFLAGVALWQVGRTGTMSHIVALAGAAVSVLWVVVTTEFRLPTLVTWPGLLGLVYFLAGTASGSRPLFATPLWVWLGEISFAVYMVHLPIDIAFYQVVERVLGGAPTGVLALALGLVAMVLCIVAAAISHRWFETPVRNWMRSHAPPWFRSRALRPAA
jgi:peptidoglycan/LPS O-acetylase OafA/YrhL